MAEKMIEWDKDIDQCALCGDMLEVKVFEGVSASECIRCRHAWKHGTKLPESSASLFTKSAKPLGIKHDTEKLRWSLLPLREIEEVIKVLMHGSKKYAPNNWKYVKPKERYIDAAFRHLSARAQGEMLDKESGMSHLAHAACCCLFLMWADTEDVKE